MRGPAFARPEFWFFAALLLLAILWGLTMPPSIGRN